MPQEIGIKLKADTRDAVKSVKDLENQVSNLENLSKKGDTNKGFLSQDDVKNFRKMAQDSERVYREFFDKLNRIQRDIEKKKKELTEASGRNASSSTTDAIERQLKELQAKKSILDSQSQNINNAYTRSQQATQSINGMHTPNGMGRFLLGNGSNIAGGLGLTFGVGQLFRTLNNGANLTKRDENIMSTLGMRTGYQGNFDAGRRKAEEVGLRDGNAYTASETMQVADSYSSLAGYKSKKDMWNRTSEIQSASRVMGIDANSLASTYGSLNQMGSLNSQQSFKQFKESMIGAIKETGMAGRDREFIKATEGLAQQVGQGQMKLSNGELKNIMGLQTALGSGNDLGLKGEKGANVLGKIDAGVKGGNNSVDAMLGWGTQYQGIDGRAEIERLKAKGIGSKEVQQKLFKNLKNMGGGNTDYQALWLKDNFGISMEEADALVKKSQSGEILKGGSMLSKAQKEGKAESQSRKEAWQNSKVQRDEENNANWENTQKAGGQYLRDASEGAKDMFFSQPKALQWAEMGAAGLGAGFLGKKAVQGVGKLFGKNIGTGKSSAFSKLKDIDLSGLKNSKATGSTSHLLGSGGKLLSKSFLPLSLATTGLSIATAKDKTKATGEGLGGLAGAAGGASAGAAIGSVIPGVGTAIGGLVGGGLGYFGGSWSGGKAVDAFRGDKHDTKEKKSAVDKEKEILNLRKGVTTEENAKLDKERRNIEEYKNMYGKESGASGSGGGGFFSNIFDKIKGFFGLGGSSLPDSSAGSGNYGTYQATGKSANQFVKQDLRKQSTDLTAADINKWIASKTGGKSSVMTGMGDAFLKASKESGLDVRYLVSHAGLETGWGTSNIAKKKGNYYGIGAFDSSPMASAFKFGDKSKGIIEGAKWIAKNFVNKGQNTLHKMRFNGGVHQYATDPEWANKIAKNMAASPKGSGASASTKKKKTSAKTNTSKKSSSAIAKASTNSSTLNVRVSGGINGLNASNNKSVTDAIIKKINGSTLNLSTAKSRGKGGNKA